MQIPAEVLRALEARVCQAIRTTSPNLVQHTFADPDRAITPRAMHPAFYGCYDWHSSVHMHWSLVRLLAHAPTLTQAADVLNQNLTLEHIAGECAYFDAPERRSFERPYGWAWILKLDAELARSVHPQAGQWRSALNPLVEKIAVLFEAHIQLLGFPVRHGVHSNTAFACVLALQWSRMVGRWSLIDAIEARAQHWFGDDVAHGVFWEPSGTDFLSSTLTEALLMSMVLKTKPFQAWFAQFLPVDLAQTPLAHCVTPTDRTDGQLVHGDGLNLSRAWCARGLIQALPLGSPASQHLRALADAGVAHSESQVTEGAFVATHWLASFWLLAQTEFEPLV